MTVCIELDNQPTVLVQERKEVVKIQTRLPAFRHMQTHTIREVLLRVCCIVFDVIQRGVLRSGQAISVKKWTS